MASACRNQGIRKLEPVTTTFTFRRLEFPSGGFGDSQELPVASTILGTPFQWTRISFIATCTAIDFAGALEAVADIHIGNFFGELKTSPDVLAPLFEDALLSTSVGLVNSGEFYFQNTIDFADIGKRLIAALDCIGVPFGNTAFADMNVVFDPQAVIVGAGGNWWPAL